MLVVGLTGGISSGKSTVVNWFREQGITVLDADEIVRALQIPHSQLLKEIAQEFGKQMLREDGSLNRERLANLIFHDEQARNRLNTITHPKVKVRMEQGIKEARQRGEKIIVLDIPLLYENRLKSWVDISIVVYVSKAIQVKRLMKRDHIDESYALTKINAQLSLEEKKRRADFVLDNRGTLDQLKNQFIALLLELKTRSVIGPQ